MPVLTHLIIAACIPRQLWASNFSGCLNNHYVYHKALVDRRLITSDLLTAIESFRRQGHACFQYSHWWLHRQSCISYDYQLQCKLGMHYIIWVILILIHLKLWRNEPLTLDHMHNTRRSMVRFAGVTFFLRPLTPDPKPHLTHLPFNNKAFMFSASAVIYHKCSNTWTSLTACRHDCWFEICLSHRGHNCSTGAPMSSCDLYD